MPLRNLTWLLVVPAVVALGLAISYSAPAPERDYDRVRQIVNVMESLGEKYQIDELAAKYSFSGRTGMSVDQALAVKEELEKIDKLIEQGIILCGSPKTVRERILQCQSEMGFGHLLAMLQVGSQPAEQTERNIRLFAEEVMPALKAHDDMIAYRRAAE
mgnify:CR=1 FL=1